jgi:hypothetical protein
MIDEIVKCQLCEFESKYCIGPAHLTSKHGITVNEYKKKFPNSKMMTDSHKANLSSKQRNRSGKVDINEDIIESDLIDLESSPKLDTPPPKIEELNLFSKIDELKKDSIKTSKYFEDPMNLVSSDKLQILNYLVCAFPKHKIVNNHYVEKSFLNGVLEYRFITDISIPSIKLDLEFPKSFWHNYDRPKEIRDYILKNDGWTIIDIMDSAPSITSVEKHIKTYLTKKK